MATDLAATAPHESKLGTTEPMVPVPYRVERSAQETHDTVTIELVPVAGGEPPLYRPGQFNMLYVFGVGEVPISISGDSGRTDRLVHTVRDVGLVTHALARMIKGDVVGVRGPFGNPWPLEAAKGHDVVLVPGGIGLAVLRPALYYVLAHRKRYGRVFLLYGARTPEELLYRHELQRWRSHLDLEVGVTVDYASRDWHGSVGVVTSLIPHAGLAPSQTMAMVCGPEVMMRFTALALLKCEVAPENVYISMERNMKCAIGICGHCQFGPAFICRNGTIFRYDRIMELLGRREI